MAKTKDWMRETAKRLSDSLASTDEVYDVLVECCQFKEGVAYMPVPRCETCLHARGWAANGMAYCVNVGIRVYIDFGCVQWEEK